jgi:cysteine synthase A
LVDEVLTVKTAEAKDMARQLSRKGGIFAGTSSGGNVHAAIRVAKKIGSSARVVTLMVDSGLKYLSTDLYRSD